jgi:hypothetical protein
VVVRAGPFLGGLARRAPYGEAVADDVARIEKEYERATELFDDLTDVRFKLLALVPTLSGTAVGLLHGGESAVTLLAVGILGLAATVGILVYELRNSETRREVGGRIKEIEPVLIGRQLVGDPPEDARKLFGMIDLRHGIGLALVYAAALAGWGYLVSWGALAALDAGHSREVGIVIGAAWGVLVLFEVLRHD